MGPPNSTGPIRKSEAIPKKYFANFGFGFGILLVSQQPIMQPAAEFGKYFVNSWFSFSFVRSLVSFSPLSFVRLVESVQFC